MKNFKIIAFSVTFFFIFMALFVLNADMKKIQQKQVSVCVSTFALYDIVKHIAPKSIDIVNILPFGVDPHSFEMTPKLMAQIQDSALVIYSGAGLEPWVEKMSFQSPVINMSQNMHLLELGKGAHEHHDEEHTSSSIDPHYWLDFTNMQRATRLITKELIKLQPKYEKEYTKNMHDYIKMLEKLDVVYEKELSACERDTVIINHNAIGYLAQRYHFHVLSLSGLSPEAEPTSSDIKRVLQEIQKYRVQTVFYENFVNSKVIKTVANDASIAVDTLDPLGNITADEAKKEMSYESLMYKNLKKLSKALLCH